MIHHTRLKSYETAYAGLDMRPLRIEVRLLERPASYDSQTPIHLDSVLSHAVVMEATEGAGLPDSAEPYFLPLPLRCEWQHSYSGLPLWACTDFLPLNGEGKGLTYWHKRVARPEFVRKSSRTGTWNIRPTAGQHKEYRMPLPRYEAMEWACDCVGNAEEIARLLVQISHVGKKRTQGHGAVEEWCIEEVDEFAFHANGRLLRPIPLLYFEAGDDLAGTLNGWTPPYWKPACQDACLRPGEGWPE